MLNDLSLSYTLILGLAIILFTGLIFGKFAKKIRVPNITGYLLGGLIIGPALANLINPDFSGLLGKDYIHALSVFATIELGFIAFSVGGEFKLSFLKQVGIMPVVIAFAEAFFAVIFITGGMLLFQFPLAFSLAMGAVGGATAPAATILVIRQYRAKGVLAKTTMAVVAIDDAAALIFFGVAIAIIRSLVSPTSNIAMTVIMPFIEILCSLLLGIVCGFILTYVINFFKDEGGRMCLIIGMIFFIIGVCYLVQSEINFGDSLSPIRISMSSLLACMAMGAIFANFSYVSDEGMRIIDRITAPFVIIFFVLSGADLQLASLSLIAVGILAIYFVFRITGKVFGTWISARAVKAPAVVQKYLGWGLLPQGGIAIGLSLIVMTELPESFNATYNGMLVRIIVICAVFISEIFGPLCLKMALVRSGEADLTGE